MRLDPRADESEIAMAARMHASATRTYLHGQGKCMPAAMLAQKLDYFAADRQARPVAEDKSLSGRIGRMLDPGWWVHNLRRELTRTHENQSQAAGYIRRSRDCYVTQHTVRVKKHRYTLNRAIMAGREIVNEDGAALNLLDVSDASISNPALRRAELMTRCRGFEEVAQHYGHQAVFLTLTAPSRFHRYTADGRDNPKYDESTCNPKKAQAYLSAVWKRTRAEFKRAGIVPYGFRVAEPHHCSCPHWHVLLFVPADQVGWFKPSRFLKAIANRTGKESAFKCSQRFEAGVGLVGIMGAYALEDEPGERGAVEHRFTVKLVDCDGETDPLTGRRTEIKGRSATGYIAKYICKNIDGLKETGESMGLDFASARAATEAAVLVCTWASAHGIRQFQPIGGPSVTVYRQLRRLGKDAEGMTPLELFEHPRNAADKGLWALFWLLQGGPGTPRAHMLRPAYEDDGQGKYGDEVKRVHGVSGVDEDGEIHTLQTRLHTWTVQGAGLAAVNADQADWFYMKDLRAKNAVFVAAMESASALRDEVAPWTGVNNCTEDSEASAVRNDFLRGQGGLTGEVTHASSSIGHCDQGKPPPPRPGGHC